MSGSDLGRHLVVASRWWLSKSDLVMDVALAGGALAAPWRHPLASDYHIEGLTASWRRLLDLAVVHSQAAQLDTLAVSVLVLVCP